MMLFAAIAPSITHLLAATSGVSPLFAQICGPGMLAGTGLADASASDLAAGVSDRNGAPDDDRGAPAPDHCPFCGSGGTMPLSMPPAAFVLTVAVATDAPPRLFLQARRPLFAWAPSHPRGPPSIS